MSEDTANRPVVVGVDGSAPSLRALQWAARQASWMHVPLEVVTAWTFPESPAPLDIEIKLPPIQEELLVQARGELDEIVRGVVPPSEQTVVHTKVIKGSAAHVLLAEAQGGALLVVGRRGCGLFEHALTGSVSERCVRHALCPVTVVS